MIERHFQIPFVARLALAEKQIQQNYRPLIAIHKWFARRPGTLFRALILSELSGERIEQTYFHGHSFSDKHILEHRSSNRGRLILAVGVTDDV
jgi:hypothetical protein